ncbi:hypothetical protein HY479_02480 [Candidatus Uhrbacteria bacterium]|nr:hypothetical protein [Candidatus Uhrbacteria bacterium]
MRNVRHVLASICLITAGTGGAFFPAYAATLSVSDLPQGFDPNFILSDSDMFDPAAFPFDAMVSFLRAKGTLATRQIADIDGKQKPAPEIIWRVAQSYKVNPKYLIALLQKEQSLVENPNPSPSQFDWAAGYGVCDACSKDDPSIQEFKGFASQVEWAAKQHREKYLIQLLTRGLTIGGQGLGKTAVIDGIPVTPTNHATAMLYSYTPHLHGNINLWRIWQRWFKPSLPDGAIVRSNQTQTTYLIRFGQKRPFASRAVVSSITDEEKIINVDETSLSGYPDGTAIKFPPYALLRNGDGEIYLLTQDVKRHIIGMDVFHTLGFNEDEINDVPDEDLAGYPDGDPITLASSYPQGVLLKTATAPGVWYVEDGKRHALADAVFLRLYFRGRKIKNVSVEKLESFERAEPYLLHAGELVKAPDEPTVYVVENGALRPIPSEEIFERVGWKWKNVITVPSKVLALHTKGDAFHPSVTEPATLATSY